MTRLERAALEGTLIDRETTLARVRAHFRHVRDRVYGFAAEESVAIATACGIADHLGLQRELEARIRMLLSRVADEALTR